MKDVFMTSPIGDLSINSEGLRIAIDEIARLRRIVSDMQKNRTLLRINRKNSNNIEEIPILRATTIKTVDGKVLLYYETINDEFGCGCKIDTETLKAWEIIGFIPGGDALLKL